MSGISAIPTKFQFRLPYRYALECTNLNHPQALTCLVLATSVHKSFWGVID